MQNALNVMLGKTKLFGERSYRLHFCGCFSEFLLAHFDLLRFSEFNRRA